MSLIFLFVIIGLFGLLIFNLANETLNFKYTIDNQLEFTINNGDSFIGILPKLEEYNLIKNAFLTRAFISMGLIETKDIKPGKYILPTSGSIKDLVEIFSKGTKPLSIRVTIPEGLTITETAKILNKAFLEKSENNIEIKFSEEEFVSIAQKKWREILDEEFKSKLKQLLPSENYSLEGLLFPDTYEFFLSSDAKQVITYMVNNFFKRIESIGELSFNPNVKNSYEAIVLGSIIEKESSKLDKKENISSVFYNRMKIGMPLQADSTINYITGKKDPGVLTRDTFIDSPYNTYKYIGLPIGPICSPGIESIKAAIYPSNTPYYFFFHDAKGQSYFSVTYAEHQQKLAKYM